MQNSVIPNRVRSLVSETESDSFWFCGLNEADGLWLQYAALYALGNKYAVLFNEDYYLTPDLGTLTYYRDSSSGAFVFASENDAIAAWEKFKEEHKYPRYQEFYAVAQALDIDTSDPEDFDAIDYAGCLEEEILFPIQEPTVWAVYYMGKQLHLLNYSLMKRWVHCGVTEDVRDRAINYLNNLSKNNAKTA